MLRRSSADPRLEIPEVDSSSDEPSWLAPACAVAAVVLGGALQVNDGMLAAGAIGYVTAAFVVLLGALLTPQSARLTRYARSALPVLCGVGLAVQIAELSSEPPGRAVQFDPASRALFTCGLAALGLVAAALIARRARDRGWLLVALLIGIHSALGVLVLRHSQGLFIDVDLFQRESLTALRKGINPYAITFPNIYADQTYYGPNTAIDGRLQFGFPYFPLTLLLVLPGELLAGDHRYAALAAIEAAAVLMYYTRRHDYGPIAAVLYLTTPRIFFVLEQSWTEPFVILGLAAVVFAACRRPRIVPWLFGAFVALKQYLVLALPAAFLLLPRVTRRSIATLFGKGALIAGAITVPFVLWNPSAFINSVVTLQFRQPFRTEALSYLAWWASAGHPATSAAAAFIVSAVLLTLVLWRLPHTPAAFAGAVAVTFLGFFAFNKQAFCNYYFFVIGALCICVAASRHAVGEPEAIAPSVAEPSSPLVRLTPVTASEWWMLRSVAVASLLPLLWPGDVSFVTDEPLLISAAVQANAAGQLAERGLPGTFGFVYGPLPTWMYQALMAVSTNLIVVAALHTVLVAVTTAIALWWLSRSLRLWGWFAAIPLLSPYFWFYSRVLWDNPFLIPLGALALAGYAAHLASDSKIGLRVAVGAMAAIPLVHLMGIAFVLPLALHMLTVRWRAVWAQRASLTVIVSGIAIMALPYWRYLLDTRSGPPGEASGMSGFLFPLLGGRVLSARELQYFYGSGVTTGGHLHAAGLVSWLSDVLVWAGIIVAAIGVVSAARLRRWTAREHIAGILLASLACQIVLDGVAGKYEHPQYYNATWIVFTLLAWFAADWAARRSEVWRSGASVMTGTLACALIVAALTVAIRLHVHHGTRDVYGPTLANQQQVARTLAEYSPASPVSVSVFPYTLYPHALETLRHLNVRKYLARSYVNLEIRYASGDPSSGEIAVFRQ